MAINNCSNANHSKTNPQVRNCPQCGGVVNKNIKKGNCSEADHSASRKNRSYFCVNCGKKLIQ